LRKFEALSQEKLEEERKRIYEERRKLLEEEQKNFKQEQVRHEGFAISLLNENNWVGTH